MDKGTYQKGIRALHHKGISAPLSNLVTLLRHCQEYAYFVPMEPPSKIRSAVLYLIILILPYMMVVIVNEYSRPGLEGYYNAKYDARGMNTATASKAACSWKCFFDTGYCKRHHVKYMQPLFKVIDPIYFGIIGLLHKAGNYAATNLLFLVIGWPALMYFLLIRILQLRKKLRYG